MSNTPTHGSDVQETPDWWKASDGRFYPPELHPDYVKPAEPAPAPSPPAQAPAAASAPAASTPADSTSADSTPSLADRLRAEADRVGDEASAAADAGVGSMGGVGDSLSGAIAGAAAAATGAASTAADAATGAASGAADAAKDAVPDGMPLTADSVDPRATVLQTPPIDEETLTQPAVTPPSMPSPGAPPSMPSPGAPPSMPSPGAPPSMPSPGAPPSMPPSPAAAPPGMPPAPSGPSGMPAAPLIPPGMPPAPGAAPAIPPAPNVEHGPGGITYTAPSEPAAAAPMGAMPATMAPVSSGMDIHPPAAVAPGKPKSAMAGIIALVAGAAAIAGSLLQWGKGSVVGSNGVEKAIIEVPGLDSSGLITAIAGGVLVLAGLLLFMGVPKQINWAALAFVAGAVIVGAVVFSAIDIRDLSERYAAQWEAEGLSADGDLISTVGDIGLWITGAGGVLGVLAAPFVKRT